jgi:hypothetical protein
MRSMPTTKAAVRGACFGPAGATTPRSESRRRGPIGRLSDRIGRHDCGVPDSRPRHYPSEDECAAILVAADRTCCVCRIGGRPIQLHHIDEDRSNADPDNFSVLCVGCHDETLRRGGFGRQLNAAQIRRYRDEWNDAVAERLTRAGRESAEGAVVIGAPPVRVDEVIDRVLEQADRSPRVGLRLLEAELDQDVRRLLGGTGWGQGRHDWDLRAAIDRLFELGVVSSSVHVSLNVFETTKAAVGGGRPVASADVLAALDVGIMTYRALSAIPRERHYVTEAGMAVFADSGATMRRDDVWAVRICSIGPPPRKPHEHLFLTRSQVFDVGSEVTWAWGTENLGQGWCLNPATGRYEVVASMAFAGVPLDDIA